MLADYNFKRPLWQRKSLWAGLLLLFVIILLLGSGDRNETNDFKPYDNLGVDLEDAKNSLHLLIPASDADINVCKVLTTAGALGYPTPTLINWQKNFTIQSQMAGGAHLAKIGGTLDWLRSLDESQKEDLVVIADAYDLWFQLPPEVLIERYYASTAAWDARMKTKPGMSRAMKHNDIKTTILFSADKGCSPQQASSPFCYLQPESPLPSDLWGDKTDTELGWDGVSSHRKRWLNSGLIMGPAQDLIKVFSRAWSYLDDEMYGSDQSLFNLVFAEQEYTREVWRQEHMKWHDRNITELATGFLHGFKTHSTNSKTASGLATASEEELEEIPDAAKVENLPNPSFPHHKLMADRASADSEYHISLDYFSSLSHATFGAEHDWRLLTFNQSDQPFGMTPKDPNDNDNENENDNDCKALVPTALPADILRTGQPLPLAVVRQGQGHETAPPLNWTQLVLYTDMCSGSVPVTIHHNAGGGKLQRWWMWPHFWLSAYGKRALQYRRLLPPSRQNDADDTTAAKTRSTKTRSKARLTSKSVVSSMNLVPIAHSDTGLDLTYPELCSTWDTDIFIEQEQEQEQE